MRSPRGSTEVGDRPAHFFFFFPDYLFFFFDFFLSFFLSFFFDMRSPPEVSYR